MLSLLMKMTATAFLVRVNVMHYLNFCSATMSYDLLENSEKRICGSVFELTLFSLLISESSSESECDSDDDSSCSSSSDSEVFDVIAEIKRKKAHPDRLHEELWYNDPGQVW